MATAFGQLEVDERPVLLMALEDSDRRLQSRIFKLDPDIDIPEQLDYLTKIHPGLVVPTVEQWLQRLPEKAKPLVILDTLGKVLPLAALGEGPYQRDYRIGGQLKAVCDRRPGMSLLGLHHDRKASSDDFVDAVSGTNGIAGAVDTVIVVSRPRNEPAATLKVTGRDVTEREYLATFQDCHWRLVGDSLAEAVAAAETLRATANLGDRSAEILQFVNSRREGVRGGDVPKSSA